MDVLDADTMHMYCARYVAVWRGIIIDTRHNWSSYMNEEGSKPGQDNSTLDYPNLVIAGIWGGYRTLKCSESGQHIVCGMSTHDEASSISKTSKSG